MSGLHIGNHDALTMHLSISGNFASLHHLNEKLPLKTLHLS